MGNGGRPRDFTDEQVEDIKQRLAKYLAETEIPILVEFAYQNEIPRAVLYDYPEFSTLRKSCIDKKEAQLERMGLKGEVDKAMAIFSLKQLGWSDRQQLEHSGSVDSRLIIERPGSSDVDGDDE